MYSTLRKNTEFLSLVDFEGKRLGGTWLCLGHSLLQHMQGHNVFEDTVLPRSSTTTVASSLGPHS